MSDITQVLSQDAIAESLVAPIEQPSAEPSQNDQRLADLSTDRTDSGQFSREETRQLVENVAKPGERFVNEDRNRIATQLADQISREQAQEAQQPPTAEQIRDGIQQLDSFVQHNGLNDAISNKELVFGLAEAFGGNTSVYDGERLGLTETKVAESVWQFCDGIQWDQRGLANFAQVSPLAAKEYADDILRAFKQDPRQWDGVVNEQLLADTAFQGNVSIAFAIKNNPGVTDVSRLTSTPNAEAAYGNFLAAFGYNPAQVKQQDPTAFRTAALNLAYTKTRHMLSFMDKRGQIQPQAQATRQRGNRTQAAGKSSPFKTNRDYFDNEVLERLELEKGIRKRGEGDFTGKGKRPAQRFQTNADIFDDATLEAFNGRL